MTDDATLAALEARVKREYGRGAGHVLAGLPVDRQARVKALCRLLGEPEPTPLEGDSDR
jgi:hypothetical protein